MRWVVLVTSLCLIVAAGWAGWALGRRSTRAATGAIGVCLAVILLRVVLHYVPGVEFLLAGSDAYAIWRPWWAMPFAVGLLAAGSHHMSTEGSKRGLRVFAVLIALLCGERLVASALFDPDDVTGVVGASGVCSQSTSYTCGAAAGAMLLGKAGVVATEREMAVLSWTNSVTGTDEFCVVRGLRQKLAAERRSDRVLLGQTDYAGLIALARPAAVTVAYQPFVDHWVVVFEAKPSEVVYGDPLAGVVRCGVDEFLARWRGVYVALEPEPAGG